jgi:hypothetical protein
MHIDRCHYWKVIAIVKITRGAESPARLVGLSR